MNKTRLYWILTLALCVFMAGAATMYFVKADMASAEFSRLGYPVYLVPILATLKFAGVAVLLANRPSWLVEWAYAGFFFDFSLALLAHLNAGDGHFIPPIVALALLIGSRTLLSYRNEGH